MGRKKPAVNVHPDKLDLRATEPRNLVGSRVVCVQTITGCAYDAEVGDLGVIKRQGLPVVVLDKNGSYWHYRSHEWKHLKKRQRADVMFVD